MFQESFATGELREEGGAARSAWEPRVPSRLAGLFSALVSLAVLVSILFAMRHVHLASLLALIPRSPAFWCAYAANYLIQPAAEWLIYHHLWGLPLTGLAALLRKLVSNELLLGYLGEVQFYAWARARLNMVAAPFGAIKDVTILSALTGNIATLAMLVFAWPFIMSGRLGVQAPSAFMLLGLVLVTSFVILLFRQKLFSLPRRELALITVIHFLRICAYVGLSALMWHLVLPDIGYTLWLVLATLRMLVSRLPLIPNKDIAFAGIAVFVLGHDAQIPGLTTMMAGLLLVTHIGVGAIFATADLVASRKAR